MMCAVCACRDAGCTGEMDARRGAFVCELAARARNRGFTHYGCTPATSLSVNPAVRSLCAENRCQSYGRNWTCPPACGTLDDFSAALASRSVALVVQTVGQLEDEFDVEGMMAAERVHKERFAVLAQDALDGFNTGRQGLGSGIPRPLPLSVGACTLCTTCSCPDAPCRHPDRALVSMEAAGLMVSEACETAGLPYYHGPGTISYTSCILL